MSQCINLIMETSGRMLLVMALAPVLITGLSSSAFEPGQMAEAKAKSFQLIVYLDGAFEPNNLHSFKIVVYNSDHKKVLSEKVTPDFSDSHQKISPKAGYKITDKSKQHPSQIKVCAQQDFTDGGKKKTHDDCYNIKQNIAKTYWYTIFDYPSIEAFEGGDDGGPNPNCDPAYPDVCIKSPPPDLDCSDIKARNFKVLSPDPHGFDGDNDGKGCET
jgi:hypothetical protein